MALNVKAAMLICLGFIGGFSWLADELAGPPTESGLPLLASSAPVRLARSLALVPSPLDSQRRSDWARRFERVNPLDREAATRHVAEASAALLAPSVPSEQGFVSPALPPLLEPEPVTAVQLDAIEPTAEIRLVAQSAPPAPECEPRVYRVARGDSLASIARREWSSRDSRLIDLLLAANPKLTLRKAGRIILGEELLIPDATAAERFLAGKPWRPDAPAAATGSDQITPEAPATAAGHWYTIRPNDTLAGIATRFLNDSRRWREIAEVNRALDPQKMVPGTRIRLPLMPMIRG
jgi:LysM repeat protein